MRVISGNFRGKILKAPKGLNTRPTADRIKESVFNIISKRILNSNCLDLFAGTGSLGIECISRGCKFCDFVEKDKEAYKVLMDNIISIKAEAISDTFNTDSFNALKKLSSKGKKYDIIFLDPPYFKGLIERSIKDIYELQLLNSGGIIITEYDSKEEIENKIGDILIIRTVNYGRTSISFWCREE